MSGFDVHQVINGENPECGKCRLDWGCCRNAEDVSNTWSSARCLFDGMLRMSSGGDGIVNGFFAMLLVSAGVAMVNDSEAGKGTVY
jgi:hypothetical protein